MTPGVVRRVDVAGWTAQGDVELVVDGAGARQQRPVHGTGGHVEGRRVDEHEGALACGDHGGLGEADIIADGEPDAAVLGQIDERELVPWGEDLALLEGNLAGDVDVKEVGLAVGTDEGA